MTSNLLDRTRDLLERAKQATAGTQAEAQITTALARTGEPLRVAIAGKVKAGKSTLLNALVGEELAPTDAGECTRIVTWYREGITYKVVAQPQSGVPQQLRFDRDGGALDIDLGSLDANGIEYLTVEWPSSALNKMTLIDTPGLESLSIDLSARTTAFLAPGEEEVTPADAVIYLMRHVHTGDMRFLESFHDDGVSHATPVNSIGILSRCDEIGGGRIDSLESAEKIAERYRTEPALRRLCQTVVPVAGLLAQAGSTLTEAEFRALCEIASAPREQSDALLLSVDRFANAETAISLSADERLHLLDRLGLFGVRLATALIRHGYSESATTLAGELVRRSGLVELKEVLNSQFGARSDVLKARTALLSLEQILRSHAGLELEAVERELEEVFAGAHELAEVRLLNAIRLGTTGLRDTEVADAERLLGASGNAASLRLGLAGAPSDDEVRQAALAEIARWQSRSENPMSSQPVVDASRVLVRTGEGILAALSPQA